MFISKQDVRSLIQDEFHTHYKENPHYNEGQLSNMAKSMVVESLLEACRPETNYKLLGPKLGKDISGAINNAISSLVASQIEFLAKTHIDDVVSKAESYFNSEAFIDEIIDRIKRKQL